MPTPALPKAGVRVTSSPAGAFGRKGLVVEAKKSGLETQSGLDETTVSGNAGNGAAAERGMWQPASQRATSGVLEGERKLSVKGVASGAGKSSARSKGKKGAAEKSETTAEAAAGVDNVPVTPSASQSAEEKQGGTSGYSRPSPAVQAVVVPAVTAGAVPTVAVAAATAVASAAKPNGSKSRLSVSAPPFIPKSMHASKSAAGVDTAKGPVKQAMQSVAAGVNNQSQRAVAPSGDVGALQTRAEAGVPFTGGGPPSPERVVVTPVKKRKPVENAPSKPTASTPIVGVTALGPELAPKGIPQQNSPDAPSAPPSGVLSAPPPAVPDMNSESASSAKLETGTKKVADLVVGTIRVPHVESVSKGVAPSRVALVVKGGPRGAVRVPRAPVPIKETTAVKSAQALAEPTKSEAGSGGDEKSGEAAEKGSVEVGEPGAVAGAKPGASELSGRKGTETIEATLGDSESGSAVRDSASQSPAPTTDASVAKSTEGREESVAVATNLAVAEPPLSDNPSTNPSTNPSPEVLATASGKGGRKSKPRRLSLVARQQAPKNEQPKFAPKAAAEETKVGSSGGLVENELGGNETVPAELAAGSSAKLSKEAGKGAVPLDTKAAKAESEESTDVPGASKGEGLDSRDNKPKPKAGHGSAGAASTGKADKDRNDVRGAGAENPGTSAARPDLRDPPVPSQVEERKGSGGTSDTAELATSLSQEDSTSKVGAGQESRGGSNAGNEGGGEKTGGDDSRGTGTGPSRGGAPESGGGGGGDEGEKKDGSGASSKNDSSVAGAVKKTDASKGEEGKLAGSGREQNPADVSAGGALEGAAKSAEQRAPLRGEEAAAQLSLAEALGGGNEDRGVFKERLWSYLFDVSDGKPSASSCLTLQTLCFL